MNKQHDLPETGLVRKRAVLRAVGLSDCTLWRMRKKGKFPKPVQLTERSIAWRVEDVRAWIANRPAVNY